MTISFRCTLWLSLITTRSFAHIIMKYPVPIGNPNNSPLNSVVNSGATYPCHVGSSTDYDTASITTVEPGTELSVSFIGSAVHGGGSCQFSLSKDISPTTTSIFKVIHSVEGGCPARGISGNFAADDADFEDPSQYPVTFPDSLQAGRYVFAWTWINKVGNREMYMNCAAIQIGSESSNSSTHDNSTTKRDSDTYFDSLPDMIVVNTAVDDCDDVDESLGVSFKYANPGTSLETNEVIDDKYMVLPQCKAGGGKYTAAESVHSSSVSDTSTITSTSLTPKQTTTLTSSLGFAYTIQAPNVTMTTPLPTSTIPAPFANTSVTALNSITHTAVPVATPLSTENSPETNTLTATNTSPHVPNSTSATDTPVPSTNTTLSIEQPTFEIWGKGLGMPLGVQSVLLEPRRSRHGTDTVRIDDDISSDAFTETKDDEPATSVAFENSEPGSRFRRHGRDFTAA